MHVISLLLKSCKTKNDGILLNATGLTVSSVSSPFSSSSRLMRRSRAAVLPMLSCLANERGEILAASAASEHKEQEVRRQ